jgi:NADH:ubiquinone oxidoreductase subunit F (NADH-binding)
VPLLVLVPRSFGDYEAAGGGRGLQAALAAWPVAVIQEVARSRLRGRGGAGFPTGEKWRAVRGVGAGPRYVVCNAAEGEPATFKDRLLLRTNPYQVLEGLAIAAYAVGAEGADISLKETFTTEVRALTRALEGRCGTRTRSGACPWRSSWFRICTCSERKPGWRR